MMHKHGILLETNHNVYPTRNATRIETAIAFYNFLCLTSHTNEPLLLSNNYYNGSIGITCMHRWVTRHIDEVGHYESSGTHRVIRKKCDCGFEVSGDMPNADTVWGMHTLECNRNYTWKYIDVPNGDSKWIVDIPARDETYCTICGIT